MNQFILLLSKQELDELTYLLVTANSDLPEAFTNEELFSYTKKIMLQNNELIKLFKKLSPISQKDVSNYRLHNNCKQKQQELDRIYYSCATLNSQLPDITSILQCDKCDASSNQEEYSSLDELDKKHKK